LTGDHAKIVQGLEVVGIDGADLPVEGLGLGRAAGLVVRQRQSKSLGRWRSWRRGSCRGKGFALALRGLALLSVHGQIKTFLRVAWQYKLNEHSSKTNITGNCPPALIAGS
jgi:hypothetical protein